ncbi:MAG: hypothetical protein WCK13_05985 [Ignavibacteriota bacterium]|nr:hypothetical protein [Ignavibacteriota bacterium]
MESGPSKEQLESLFKTSRKYFDEMAKEYYAKDRDFYNKNFAPFYSNPLIAAKSGGKPAKLVIAVSLFVLIMGLSAVMLMFFTQDNTEKKPVRETDKYQEPAKKENQKSATSVKDSAEKIRIKAEEELKKKEADVKNEETDVKENTGKREVRNKPVERTR